MNKINLFKFLVIILSLNISSACIAMMEVDTVSKQQKLDEALAIAIIDEIIPEDQREKEVTDLIAQGANVNTVYYNYSKNFDCNGFCPLMLAMGYHLKGLGHFKSNELRKFNENGQTIFDWFLGAGTGRSQNLNIINILINNGADVNITDKHGRTPLIYVVIDDEAAYNKIKRLKVCSCPHFEENELRKARKNIEILLKNGADLTHKDKEGNTAFDYAKNDKIALEMLNNAKKLYNTNLQEALGDKLISDLINIVKEY